MSGGLKSGVEKISEVINQIKSKDSKIIFTNL